MSSRWNSCLKPCGNSQLPLDTLRSASSFFFFSYAPVLSADGSLERILPRARNTKGTVQCTKRVSSASPCEFKRDNCIMKRCAIERKQRRKGRVHGGQNLWALYHFTRPLPPLLPRRLGSSTMNFGARVLKREDSNVFGK